MYLHARRHVLLGSSLLLLLGCQLPTDKRTSLDMAKLYGDDLADALSASADAFIASPQSTPPQRELVLAAKSEIQTARATLDAVTAMTGDGKTAAQEIITGANILEPVLGTLLGPAALYIPMAIGVLQAFIDAWPPPVLAPSTPPDLLHEKAMTYRRHK